MVIGESRTGSPRIVVNSGVGAGKGGGGTWLAGLEGGCLELCCGLKLEINALEALYRCLVRSLKQARNAIEGSEFSLKTKD
jgi:hypothetical protein